MIFACILTFVFVLSACGQKAPASNNKDSDSEPAVTTKPNEGLEKVIYLTPGTLGDNAFSDSVNSGIQKIAKDYGAESKVIENSFDTSKYSQSVEAAFQWAPDVIFTDAYGMEDLVKEYDDRYPDVKVVNLDFVLQNESETISSVTFIRKALSWPV